MAFLDRLAAGLAWLGRHGTPAVAVSIVVGIALPPLGALIRPYFAETVVVLLVLAFLRVDPDALRAQWTRARHMIVAALWSMLILPLAGLTALTALEAITPGLLLALVLNAVAPPTFSSPALAALIGLNGAVSLALLIASTAATPFTAPALVALFFGSDVTIAPAALGIRLVLILAGSACAAIAIRALAGKPWVERQSERIDGLSVIALFGFALALMGDVLANAIAHPLMVLGLLALSTAVLLALGALTALVFLRSG
jgi:BASS family bile acid:Na+ symporter